VTNDETGGVTQKIVPDQQGMTVFFGFGYCRRDHPENMAIYELHVDEALKRNLIS